MIKNWNEVSVGTYAEILKVCEREEPEDVEIGIVSILCGKSEDEVLKMNITDYQLLRKEAQFVASFPPIKAKCPKTVTLHGRKYDVVNDVRKMTAGQYIDFQTFSKMDLEKTVVEVLSCFLVPEGKTYGEYDLTEVYDDIREDLPVVVAYEMCAFFLSRLTLLTKATLSYSERMMRRMMRKTKDKEMRERIRESLTKIQEARTKINGVGLNA